MKTEYKYIRFEKTPRTSFDWWYCRNKKEGYLLGAITYCEEWKFNPEEGRAFTIGCLRDIADFIDQLNKEANQ